MRKTLLYIYHIGSHLNEQRLSDLIDQAKRADGTQRPNTDEPVRQE